MKYAVVIEPTGAGYSAYSPDLPGCVATGADLEEVSEVMRQAIAFHLEGMREEGVPLPAPVCRIDYVEAQAT